MADYPKRPKMEFESNTPETVTLVKQPPKFKGEKEGTPWWGWEVKHNGEDKTLFANEQLQQELVHYEGKTVVINWKEETNPATKKRYHIWKVNEAVFDHTGRPAQPPPPDIKTDPNAHQEFREDRIKAMGEALQDAHVIASRFNEWLSKNGDGEMRLNHEDIRAIAISFKIDYERKS